MENILEIHTRLAFGGKSPDSYSQINFRAKPHHSYHKLEKKLSDLIDAEEEEIYKDLYDTHHIHNSKQVKNLPTLLRDYIVEENKKNPAITEPDFIRVITKAYLKYINLCFWEAVSPEFLKEYEKVDGKLTVDFEPVYVSVGFKEFYD